MFERGLRFAKEVHVAVPEARHENWDVGAGVKRAKMEGKGGGWAGVGYFPGFCGGCKGGVANVCRCVDEGGMIDGLAASWDQKVGVDADVRGVSLRSSVDRCCIFEF